MRRPATVLHLTDRLSDRGGAYRHLLAVLDGLRRRGHGVCVAAGRVEGGNEAEIIPGLESRRDEGGDATAALDALVARMRPDVIHVHTVMRPSVLHWAADHGAIMTVQDHRVFCPGRGKWTASGERCESALGAETCASCFAGEAYFESLLALTEARLGAVRRMRRVLVLSSYMARELSHVGVSRVTVIPPFVHGLTSDEVPEAGGAFVLFAGRLATAKGVWAAVEAWRRADVGLPLVFAGTGPLRTKLEREGFLVLGWLGRQELSRIYRRASVVVLPSFWQEPFGIVGLEALSLGVPVAAWDSGGVREWHPGEGLVGWGDVAALAEAIRGLAGRRGTLGPGFDEASLMDRLVAVYDSLR